LHFELKVADSNQRSGRRRGLGYFFIFKKSSPRASFPGTAGLEWPFLKEKETSPWASFSSPAGLDKN
jgi:hypothetical protein